MRRWTLLPWAAVLTVVLALAPPAASAQEQGTVTISGTFSMDFLDGSDLDLSYIAPELLTVYDNGHEHTWTLTLHGTTQSHNTNGSWYGTDIQATSFDLEFFGPDADLLNGVVSEHLAGKGAYAYLQNTYYDNGGGLAIMHVGVGAWGTGDLFFYTGHDIGVDTLFPADEDGYPVVGPEPFSIQPDYTELGTFELFSGWGGGIGSLAGPVTFAGNVGEPPPPPALPTLAIQDGSVLEGKKGTTKLNLNVTLSASSTSTVTVNYTTADGTAIASSDYNSASGTLTFQPGQTSKTISIGVKGDRKREPDETFTVQLSNAVGATIEDGSATVTIRNDD